MADQLHLYKIKLGREYYHLIDAMKVWCEKNIGEGTWNSWHEDHLPVGHKWDYDQMFGYTTFRFRDPRDYSKFVVKWEWTDGKNSSS